MIGKDLDMKAGKAKRRRPGGALGSMSLMGMLGKGVQGIGSLLGLGGFNAPGARQNFGDRPGAWVCAGEPTTPTPTSQQTGILWAGNRLQISSGTPLNSILIETPRITLSENAAPGIQSLHIAACDGQIDFGDSTSVGGSLTQTPIVNLSVGIYVAEMTESTGLYATQDPSSSSSVSRFDWIYLESRTFMTTVLNPSAVSQIAFPVAPLVPKVWDLMDLALDVTLHSGEALMLSIAVTVPTTFGGLNTGTIIQDLYPALRLYLNRAAI